MSRVDNNEIPAAATVSNAVSEQLLRINDSTQVNGFIQRGNISDLIHKSVTLIHEFFPKLCGIVLEVSRDPEEPVEWIIVRLTSAAPQGELTSAYRQYVQRWVRETPPDKRHLVRLSYTSV